MYADRAGSVHDARVLRVSSLAHKIETGRLCTSAQQGKCHLLGDSAYPLLPSLLVPYRDNGHLTHTQQKFNHIHSATRSIIERAFGRLKGMFRRLKGIDCTYPVNALHIIEAAFTLHNYLLEHECDESESNDSNICNCSADESLATEDTVAFGNAAVRKAAKVKRDTIADSL